MDLTQALEKGADLIKWATSLPIRILVNVLNLFPSNVYEGITIQANLQSRNFHSIHKGRRKLRLGSAIVANMRGYVFEATDNSQNKFKAVWTDDFEKVVSKWSV